MSWSLLVLTACAGVEVGNAVYGWVSRYRPRTLAITTGGAFFCTSLMIYGMAK